MANYVTENGRYILIQSDISNPLFQELTKCEIPERLGDLYVIAHKKTFNPRAVAVVNEDGFSIYTADEQIDISDKEISSSLGRILDTYAARKSIKH